MEINTIISYHTISRRLPMVFLTAGMLAMPVAVHAQDDMEDAEPVKKTVVAPVRKHYATRHISGRVLSAVTHKPLPGAIVGAVGVQGYTALTDDDGSFAFDVPVFASSITVKLPSHNLLSTGLVKGEKQGDLLLYPSTFTADYDVATDLRNDRSASDMQYSSALNIKEEIEKQLGAYAHVITRNNTPGVGANMYVQGLNSIYSNAQPLIVVDGVVFDQQYGHSMLHSGFANDILTAINPADIDKVTVLRNGTALYGSKGANGVILIETKRSKSMATRITASLSAGVTFEPKFIDMMNASQYRGYASELLKSTGTPIRDFKWLNADPNYYYYKQYHNDTDWKDEIYRSALTQNYGIQVEGGDKVASYNLSVGYTTANSTLKYNNMNRFNIRFNTDIHLIDPLSIRFDASYSNTTRGIRDDGAPAGYDDGTPTAPSFLGYVKSPFLSPYSYGHGELSTSHLDITAEDYLSEALADYNNYNWKLANPWALNTYGDGENKNRFENSMLNLSITPVYTINPHLQLSEHFSYTLVNANEKYYVPINGVPEYYVSSVNGYRTNEVRSLFAKQNSMMSDTRLAWNNRYAGHSVSAFGGVRVNWEEYRPNYQLGYNTGSDKTPFMSSSLMNATSYGTNEKWRNINWYAQAQYDYLRRYFLTADFSAESSSLFGRDADGGAKICGVVWGLFPSVQAAWVMTNEPWLAGNPIVNYLRLTTGYDVSGNDNIGYYAAHSYLSSKLFINAIAGKTISGIGNTKVKWETTGRANFGLDARLFNNRVSVGFNVYKSWTRNLLMLKSLNFLSGLDSNWSNDGKLENTGFDVSLSGKILALKDFQWEAGATLGHYKNKVTALVDGAQAMQQTLYGVTIRSEVGKAANLFYGYKTSGVFATSDEAQQAGLYILDANGVAKHYFQAGDMRFVDVDGNHEINEKDMTVIGDPNPDIYGNLFTALTYKRFRLEARFNYSVGNDVYNYMRSQLEGGSRFMNQTTALNSRWQAEGQQTSVPRATFQDPMGNSRFSDRWIEDGSYLRLKTLTLSYDLPVNSTFFQGFQFWIQANNLFTVTKYLGSDPEFSATSSVIGQGIDLGELPQSRSVVAGVKINL